MLERVRCRIEKCVKFSDLYRSQNLKYFMTVKKLTERQMRWSLILLQYNFFILYLLSKQNESRCSIETEAECVNESLRWQSTTLYNTDNTFWDDKQAYTGCLNDSSRHIISVLVQDQNLFSEITDLKQMWVNAEAEDELYNELCQTIQRNKDHFLLF
jgi:hypothetical protein